VYRIEHSQASAGIVDVRLGTALLRPLWYAAEERRTIGNGHDIR